jgi:uncharacterized membrane protein (UPF0127 family)
MSGRRVGLRAPRLVGVRRWVAALAALLPATVDAACAPDIVEIDAGGRTIAFFVEIADEPQEQAQGLMFRDDLGRDEGMLFLWDSEAPRSFWMKNTPLSLDMVFIDAEGRVCGLVERAEPYTLDPRPSGCAAMAVLEIHGGLSARYGVEIGARVRHPAFGAEAAWPCE